LTFFQKILIFIARTKSNCINMTKFRRREFLKTGLMAGGAVMLSSQLAGSEMLSKSLAGANPPSAFENPDIATISGDDLQSNIPKLLAALGGIGKFVSSGQTVGILANSPWKNPGFYTNPDVVLVVADLCLKAGAKKVICLKSAGKDYWERGQLYEKLNPVIEGLSFGTDKVEVTLPGGVSLKKAEVYKELSEVDVFISIPVAKHHNGTNYSGNLKGMMGASSSGTNRHMHSPEGDYTYNETEYLAQCIADLCLVRKPDLCVIDAIECATGNGPAGPGPTVKPGKIIAGRDPLATDVYAAGLIGFSIDDVLTFKKAYEHKLGETDLSKLKILEL
jgi:uncharacterized protein (DUF362 family)